MKKSIGISLVIITIFCFVLPCNASFFGLDKVFKELLKVELSALKQDIKGDINGVKGDISLLKGSAEAILKSQIEIRSRIEASVEALAGVNNQISKVNTTVGRDNSVATTTTTTNDADLMWKIIYGLLGIIGTLLSLITWVVKRLFKEMSNARYYQIELAANLDQERIREVMKQKHEYENEKKLTSKLVRVFKKGKINEKADCN